MAGHGHSSVTGPQDTEARACPIHFCHCLFHQITPSQASAHAHEYLCLAGANNLFHMEVHVFAHAYENINSSSYLPPCHRRNRSASTIRQKVQPFGTPKAIHAYVKKKPPVHAA